jgi:hypothetical protein
MIRNTLSLLLVVGVILAAPSYAGTLYVPIVATEVDGISFETMVSVTNPTPTDAQYSTYFIPRGSDGTVRDEQNPPGTFLLLGNQTVPMPYAPADVGVLEIDTDSQLVYQARLEGNRDGVVVSTPLPIVSEKELFQANEVAYLQGWARNSSQATAFGILNLGRAEAECLVDVVRRNGVRLVDDFHLTLPPLGQLQFDDPLAFLNENGSELWTSVRCDQPFYAYGVAVYPGSNEIRTIFPSTSGNLAIADTSDPAGCSPEAVCFEKPGTFYVPVTGDPRRQYYLDVPAGRYSKVRLRMEVRHGGWQNPSSGLHNIFWLAIDSNFNLLGYVNLRGPNTNKVLFRHGIGLPLSLKPKIEPGFVAVPGETYFFDYIYDTDLGRIDLFISAGGQEVLHVVGSPNVGVVNLASGQRFRIDISFLPGLNPNEPPTYGWQYKNLVAEFFPE